MANMTPRSLSISFSPPLDNRTLIRSGEAPVVGWSRQMLYSGFNILPRSVIRSANSNGRSDNLDVIPLECMIKIGGLMPQFSTRSLLLALSYISIVFAVSLSVLRHMRFYDVGILVLYPGVLGCMSFVAIYTSAAFRFFQPKGTAPWHWLSLAWLLVCLSLIHI